MKRIVLVFLTSILLVSCATIPSANLGADKFKLEENEGAIAGVVGLLKKSRSSISHIFYTNEEIQKIISKRKYDKYGYLLEFGTTVNVSDFEKEKDDPYEYFFFVLKQKPGNYKFNEYTFFFNSGYIQESVGYEITPNLEFNIEKGKIKYFGTMFLNSRTRELNYTQEFREYDIQKFKEKLPHIVIEQ